MKRIYNITAFFVLLLAASVWFGQEASELEKGVGAYDQGNYQEAADVLQKLVAADAKNREAWLYLGMSRARLKNKSEAVKAFKKAKKISDGEGDTDTDATGTKVKIISKPRAQYTDAARQNLTQGTIVLAVEFGADGKIKEVFTVQGLPNGLTENCVAAAKRIRFDPAVKNGKPYSTIKFVTYSFTIY